MECRPAGQKEMHEKFTSVELLDLNNCINIVVDSCTQ
jgi:hypothetical protein